MKTRLKFELGLPSQQWYIAWIATHLFGVAMVVPGTLGYMHPSVCSYRAIHFLSLLCLYCGIARTWADCICFPIYIWYIFVTYMVSYIEFNEEVHTTNKSWKYQWSSILRWVVTKLSNPILNFHPDNSIESHATGKNAPLLAKLWMLYCVEDICLHVNQLSAFYIFGPRPFPTTLINHQWQQGIYLSAVIMTECFTSLTESHSSQCWNVWNVQLSPFSNWW